jgi:hypothetical protein
MKKHFYQDGDSTTDGSDDEEEEDDEDEEEESSDDENGTVLATLTTKDYEDAGWPTLEFFQPQGY